ncbi:Protein PIR [Apostasia shenzhenica]|uniref:Protein PIR n=1 Tax=Apostasia shenzhenica TaxID=1088818 RepID=A0A2I0BF87_9ASPA|nr:Protein PIR [Apostasia shenzhenica]
MQFMQIAPWLGLVTGSDGQVKQVGFGISPLVSLFRVADTGIISNATSQTANSFHIMSKQAEAAGNPKSSFKASIRIVSVKQNNVYLLYKTNMNSGSVLEYALAFASAALDRHYSKLSAAPKTGFIDITTSKDFYRIFSALQFECLEEMVRDSSKRRDLWGDSVAWAGCTIIYLLGQQLHFELFDFSYQLLNIAEVEIATISQIHSFDHAKSVNYIPGYEGLLEAMKKARRLNNHVFSILQSRSPLEDKVACAIKQSGAPQHRVTFLNTISAFDTLPQKNS